MIDRTLNLIAEHWKTFVFLIVACVFIYAGLVFEWDKQIMAGLLVILGVLSNAFAGLIALITLVPFIGPLLIKVLSIPAFWILNAGGYFVSIIFVKKGYGSSVVQGRVLTIVLLFGVVIGFILGKIV